MFGGGLAGGGSAPGYIVHPDEAIAFDATQFSFAPLFSLRPEASSFLLPRPANPKDILRPDPEDVHQRMLAGLDATPKAVAQLQGTPFGVVALE
jgi:hypothetical protein